MVMPRKFSQPTVSLCGSWNASLVTMRMGPRPALTSSSGARFEDVRCAAGRHDHRLGAENIEVAGANVETDCAGDPIGPLFIHQQVSDHDPVVDFAGGFARGFGDDWLVAFAVDHDLPFAFALISSGLGVAHDRQTPFLKLMHRGVDVARNVVAQILANE